MSNVLAAVAVGLAMEAPLEDIVRGVEEVDAVPGRCELVDEEQPFAVLVDYAHSPDALARLLDTIRECAPSRIITGGPPSPSITCHFPPTHSLLSPLCSGGMWRGQGQGEEADDVSNCH